MKRVSLRTLPLALSVLFLASCNGSSSGGPNIGNLPGPPVPTGFARAFIGDCTFPVGKVHLFAPPFSPTSTETGAFGPSNCGNALSANPANGMLARTAGSTLYIYNPPYSSSTTPTVTMSGGATTLAAPFQPAWDASGNLWVADPGAGSVKEFSPPFSATNAPAATNTNVGAAPVGLAINPSAGLMFVGDAGSPSPPCNGGPNFCHIYVVPAPYTGVPTATFTFGTSIPEAIAVDQLGRLFVGFSAGSFSGLIKVYLPPYATGNTAAYTLTVGAPVEGLAFDASQNLYAQKSDSSTAVFSGPILGSIAAPSFTMPCPVACGSGQFGGITFGP